MESDTSGQLPRSFGARLWWLIIGRGAAVILLVLIGVAWKSSALGRGVVTSLSTVTPIILTAAGLTLVYCAARLLWKNYQAQARLQFLGDILLVTWLVGATGKD